MLAAFDALAALLTELFTEEELREFLFSFGVGDEVEEHGVMGAVRELHREGRLDASFFAALVAAHPERRERIERLQGVVVDEAAGDEPAGSRHGYVLSFAAPIDFSEELLLAARAVSRLKRPAQLEFVTRGADEATSPHLESAALAPPDRRVVNILVQYDGTPARLPLSPVPHLLRINVGPVATGTTVVQPTDLPPEVLEAARISPIQLDVLVLSPSCVLNGVAPPPDSWARLALRLGLGPDGSPWLDVPFQPMADGFVRVILSWRGQVLQSLRFSVRLSGRSAPVRTRVEFAVSAALRDLEALPERRVALTLNDVGGRRAVAVIVPGETTEVEAAGISDAFFAETVPVLRDLVEGLARHPETGIYRFGADNQGDRATLASFLQALAPEGALAWRSLFNKAAGELLRQKLQASNAAIQVAGLAEGEAVPWGFLYDLPLREKPERTCLITLDEGLLPWEACRARPDCPLSGPNADRVVCPWGFWGFKHRIEEPPMRVDEAPDRELVHEVRVQGPVRAVMGVHQTLDKDGAHRAAVRGIDASVTVVGDKADVPGPDELQGALADPDLHLVYLYCHGGVGWGLNKRRVWLSVGRTLEDRFAPDQVRYWELGWKGHPLVIVNGCNTTRVDPSQLANFVREFAAQGAAGVVGTETTVWESLAREVGRRLLEALVAGKPLGEALLCVRHALLRDRLNPLGLVYSAYASVDLRLVRSE